MISISFVFRRKMFYASIIGSNYFSPPKPPEDHQADRSHQAQGQEITVVPPQLRHVVEVHAVNTGNKGQRQKKSGENRQQLHYLVVSLRGNGQVGRQ